MIVKETEIFEINTKKDWENIPLKGFYKELLRYSGVEFEIKVELKDGRSKKIVFINNMLNDIE